jgi:predicted dehydrogenase
MYKVRIIGAGSIGNHLANGFVNNGFYVEITDKDSAALYRTMNEIYPARYGSWDDRIVIVQSSETGFFETDVLVIGTPPDTHIEVVIQQLKRCSPSIVLIEKPISSPDMENFEELAKICQIKKIRILVGYNHRLTENTMIASRLITEGKLGEVFSITSQTRESWNGILKAHPWLDGPEDSYLAWIEKGGGALYEHSHALNLLQYFMSLCNTGSIVSVLAAIDIVSNSNMHYDRFSFLSLANDKGEIFHVIQDVVSIPPLKELKISGSLGALIWRTSSTTDEVLLYNAEGSLTEEYKLIKTRADDFRPEVLHIRDLLDGLVLVSPIDFKFAIDTMEVISAAFESSKTGTRVLINL